MPTPQVFFSIFLSLFFSFVLFSKKKNHITTTTTTTTARSSVWLCWSELYFGHRQTGVATGSVGWATRFHVCAPSDTGRRFGGVSRQIDGRVGCTIVPTENGTFSTLVDVESIAKRCRRSSSLALFRTSKKKKKKKRSSLKNYRVMRKIFVSFESIIDKRLTNWSVRRMRAHARTQWQRRWMARSAPRRSPRFLVASNDDWNILISIYFIKSILFVYYLDIWLSVHWRACWRSCHLPAERRISLNVSFLRLISCFFLFFFRCIVLYVL